MIGVDRMGRFWLAGHGGGIGIEPRDLSARLGAALAGLRPVDRKIVYVRADHDVPYGRVLDAVAAARVNDVRTVGLITEPPPATRPDDL
jgi:biopolymer transport protein ExbD